MRMAAARLGATCWTCLVCKRFAFPMILQTAVQSGCSRRTLLTVHHSDRRTWTTIAKSSNLVVKMQCPVHVHGKLIKKTTLKEPAPLYTIKHRKLSSLYFYTLLCPPNMPRRRRAKYSVMYTKLLFKSMHITKSSNASHWHLARSSKHFSIASSQIP